jgi:prevent-host-death family protein
MVANRAANSISFSEATTRGLTALVRAAEEGQDQIITRDGKPVVVITDAESLERRQALEEDLVDLTLAASRMVTTGPERYVLDEVLRWFGYSRQDFERMGMSE